jgi:hypothetical protein
MTKTKTRLLPLLLVLAVAALAVAPLRADFREEFSKTLPLKAGDVFSLENVNGGVTVATWKENTVEIKAVKVARDNKEDLKDVEIRVDGSAGSVSVKAIWPRNRRHFNVSVKFDVKVPEGVRLDRVETVNGDVDVTGSYASAELGSTNGSITASGVKGPLDAATTNGGIKVSGQEGKLHAETTNGSIKLEGLTFKDGLEAETTNGSITIAIANPDQINALLSAETTNGHVSVDFPITLKNLNQSLRRIEAQIGQGGPEISLHTTNGSIRLTK